MKNSDTQTNTEYGGCLSILYPKFVDDTTELDRVYGDQSTYVGVVLKAFIKNVCTNSIVISTTNLGLDIGPIVWNLKDGEFLSENPEYLIENKIKLAANDSIFLSIAEFDLFYVPKLDSIQFLIHYENKNRKVDEFAKLYKADFK